MDSIHRMRAVLAVAVAGAVGFVGAAYAQYQQDQPPTTRPAAAAADTKSATDKSMTTDAKPIIPNRAETADSAFKKLDPAGKGYVAREDAKQLSGFDAAFQQNDANHDGRLSADEFRKAWMSYTGNK